MAGISLCGGVSTLLYSESASERLQSLALWSSALHVAQMCLNKHLHVVQMCLNKHLHVPWNEQQPLFHDAQIFSRVSASDLPGTGGSNLVGG